VHAVTRRAAPSVEVGSTRARVGAAPWRPPTRRVFVAMIGAAAAALAVGSRGTPRADDAPSKRLTGAPRWIGHC